MNREAADARYARVEHASRHAPNGQDALPTAAGVACSATSQNTEGNADSYSRSNHTHQIMTGAASTQLPDQTNATGSSQNLARADHRHNIPTASPIGTGTQNLQGTAQSFARSDHQHNTVLVADVAMASGEVQTTSTNDVILNGMSVTPPAGTYMIDAFVQFTHQNSNGIAWASLYVGNTQQSNTLYSVSRGGNQGNVTLSWAAKIKVTVNGSTAITIRWRSQSGTARAFGRYISYMRVG